jgi:biopolymer transport protein ExbB
MSGPRLALAGAASGLMGGLALLGSAGAAAAQDVVVARNLTVTGMVSAADPLVKAVMGILVLASLATWTIWIAKSLEIAAAKKRLVADIELLDKATSLQGASEVQDPTVVAMVETVRAELARGGDLRRHEAGEAVKERAAARLGVLETNAVQRILRGVNILASIGATSPFIGLSGTVWGIMNSFIGISKAHATNLAVVAPGIAEALLATAMGLIAAIPAVLIYNMLARAIAGYRRMVAESAVLTACALSREVEARAQGAATRSAAMAAQA